jgi:hypothetical protein
VIRWLSVALLISVLTFACGDDSASPPSGSPANNGNTPPAATPSGPPPSPAAGTIDLASAPAAMTIYGADSGDYLNDLPLLVTGDVDGDGRDDLLIGARFGDGPGNTREDSGEAYLIYGRETLPRTLDIAAGEPDVTFYGEEPGDQIGYAGLLADINDDGFDDVVLAAPFGRSNAGAVYILFGGSRLPAIVDLAETSADTLLTGPQATSYFGDAVSATDANGDGVTDLIVGATFARRPSNLTNAGANAGAAYVFLGRDGFPDRRDAAEGDFDAVIYGENSDPHPDELGDNVWGADVNGDGIGDIIVTAEAADGPNNERSVAAEVHVLFGSSEMSGVYDIARGDQDLSILGADQNDTLGFQLTAGDVNNDGIGDIVASARGADGLNNTVGEAGEVHIVLGRVDLPETIDLLNDESDAYLYGASGAEMLGYSLEVLDLERDGRNELMIGTGFADGTGGRFEAGAVYVVDASSLSGAVRVAEAPLKIVYVGAQADDQLGAAATSGDINGDGIYELVLLAMRADGPDGARPDAGVIYVVRP